MFKEKIIAAIEAVEKEAREYLASQIILQGGSLQYEVIIEEEDSFVYSFYDKLICKGEDIYATSEEGGHREYCLNDDKLCGIASDIYYWNQKEREGSISCI